MVGRTPDVPVRFPVNLQRWRALTFLHWPVDPGVLRPLVDDRLEIDTFDGVAWVGVTPFLMTDVRVPGVKIPLVPRFTEVNVRTYVRAPGGPGGLWFLSLEAASLPIVAALTALGLPYVRAAADSRRADGADLDDPIAEGTVLDYVTRRPRSRGTTREGAESGTTREGAESRRMRARVEVGAALGEPNDFENFLTGRWNAFFTRVGKVWRVPVEHEPWPLRTARAEVDAAALVAADGVRLPQVPPLVHFSPGVHVKVGAPRLVMADSR